MGNQGIHETDLCMWVSDVVPDKVWRSIADSNTGCRPVLLKDSTVAIDTDISYQYWR